MSSYDAVIIGGGINGCGCAADAAMRGLSVLLCEQDDLASKTSSSSSQLIHGGLRYLEQYDFSLVKKSRDEQQTLLNIAPYIVHSLPFVLPHADHNRPMWLLRLGLFLYDHLSRSNTLPHHQRITRHTSSYFQPLKTSLHQGFLFYDCTADDARLTALNALQAKKHGAQILTQTKCTAAEQKNGQWKITLTPHRGDAFQIQSRVLIQATGPWVQSVSAHLNLPLTHELSLVKGSHLVVPRLYEGEHAYVLQHDDQRIVFVIPYHGHTLIGTTDRTFTGSPDDLHIDHEEIDYLCDLVNHYFKKSIQKQDVLYTWSGVRPLLQDNHKNASTLSRGYTFQWTPTPAPLLNIYGGKITTYRQLAVDAIDHLQQVFPSLPASHTKTALLPGATHDPHYPEDAKQRYVWLPEGLLDYYLAQYGTLTDEILKDCHVLADLGHCFEHPLYQVEIDYLKNNEWVMCADDLLWRRTKLGLRLSQATTNLLKTNI